MWLVQTLQFVDSLARKKKVYICSSSRYSEALAGNLISSEFFLCLHKHIKKSMNLFLGRNFLYVKFQGLVEDVFENNLHLNPFFHFVWA